MSRRGFSKNMKRFDTKTLNVEQLIGDIISDSIESTSIRTENLDVDSVNFSQVTQPINFNNQSLTNVNIESGSINNTIIGNNIPSSATFTSLIASGGTIFGSTISPVTSLFLGISNMIWNGATSILTVPILNTNSITSSNLNITGSTITIGNGTSNTEIQDNLSINGQIKTKESSVNYNSLPLVYTNVDIQGGIITIDTSGGSGIATSPTAAQIISIIPNAEENDVVKCLFINYNHPSNTITLTGSTGVTTIGTPVIGPESSRLIYFKITNFTLNLVTMY